MIHKKNRKMYCIRNHDNHIHFVIDFKYVHHQVEGNAKYNIHLKIHIFYYHSYYIKISVI